MRLASLAVLLVPVASTASAIKDEDPFCLLNCKMTYKACINVKRDALLCSQECTDCQLVCGSWLPPTECRSN
ncbi:hypothetical protein GQ42DRAFT_31909 [Ramicandelaber brevisporus]|nr:hypothetical protein GQ42DRAFT_31909 [Ramicandelaber brevisporus]